MNSKDLVNLTEIWLVYETASHEETIGLRNGPLNVTLNLELVTLDSAAISWR
jgi:hypothetical protein